MADKLTIAMRVTPQNRAVLDGNRGSRGLALDLADEPVLVKAFRKMVRSLEYDISEMALTTYICAKAHGAKMTAIPVFPVRGLHHDAISVSGPGVSIDELVGQCIGVVRGYTVTTGVWARGVLSEECGLDLDAVTWVRSDDEHVPGFLLPENVRTTDADPFELLTNGQLAAVVGKPPPGDASVVPLFDDPRSRALESVRRTAIYPINHVVVIRDDLLKAQPDLAITIFDRFTQAKQAYVAMLSAETSQFTDADPLHKDVMEIIGDPLPYGIEPNRTSLEKLLEHLVRQRILTHTPRLEDLFHPSTHQLYG